LHMQKRLVIERHPIKSTKEVSTRKLSAAEKFPAQQHHSAVVKTSYWAPWGMPTCWVALR
jgi:hypothetical protein